MSGRMSVTLAALVFWLIPAVAPAATFPLFACQLGNYTQFDGSDGLGNQWKAKIKVVAENITLNGKTYFHIRLQNWDPYRSNPRGAEDALLRSTDVDAFLSLGGDEWRQFSTTGTPPSWQYWDPPGQIQTFTQAAVTRTLPVTLPIGTFPQAYENRSIYNEVNPPHISPPLYAYLVPGPGLIQEINKDVDPARGQSTLVLNSAGSDPVSLFNLKTGLRLTYDASDKLGKKWQMTMLVQEQVTFGGHTYFRVLQKDYYSPGQNRELYLRCSANQAWISYDGVTEHLAFQAAGPGTYWTYDDPWEEGTDYTNIASIGPINVIGASVLAYRHDGGFAAWPGVYWVDYVVPGLGIVRKEDSDFSDPSGRAPLIFTLAKMTQGSASPAVNLLLLN